MKQVVVAGSRSTCSVEEQRGNLGNDPNGDETANYLVSDREDSIKATAE